MRKSAIDVAVVGTGYWGPNLARAVEAHPAARLSRICDLDPDRRAYMQEQLPHVPVTASFDEIVEDRSIDAVMLATPVATHVDLGVRLLEAGKHVLVEKPMALSAAGAYRLLALAEERGRILACGHVYLHHPAIRSLRALIADGAIGELEYVTTERANVSPPDPAVDVVWDLGVHDVAMAMDLLGAPPGRVHAVGAQRGADGRWSSAYLHVEYRDGRYSHHSLSWHFPGRVRKLQAAGTDGYAIFDETAEHALTLYGPAVDSRATAGGRGRALTYAPGAVDHPPLDGIRPLDAECDAFIAAVRGHIPMIGDGRSAALVVQVLEAASRSLRSGKPETLEAGFAKGVAE